MEIKLFREDLKEEYQDLSPYQIRFQHLNAKAQIAVGIAGRGVYWSGEAYETVYPRQEAIQSPDKSS